MWAILIPIIVAVVGGAVVYLVKGFISGKVNLGQRDAALELEQEHTAQVDKAEAEARAKRAKEFDVAKSEVHDAAGAADLVRSVLGQHPKSN